MATCGKCGYDGPFAHGCGPSPASVSLVPRVNELETENARLQEERGNLQRLNTQMHEINDDRVLECTRLQAALTEAEERGVELWEFAEDIVACPAAFERASLEGGEMRRERDHYKALLGFFESAGFPTPQDILEKIDGYKALAERRGEALEWYANPAAHRWGPAGREPDIIFDKGHRARTAMTPEEAEKEARP